MIEKVRHRGKVENSRVLQSAAGFRRSQTADQTMRSPQDSGTSRAARLL
jgi:hypothetical protein